MICKQKENEILTFSDRRVKYFLIFVFFFSFKSYSADYESTTIVDYEPATIVDSIYCSVQTARGYGSTYESCANDLVDEVWTFILENYQKAPNWYMNSEKPWFKNADTGTNRTTGVLRLSYRTHIRGSHNLSTRTISGTWWSGASIKKCLNPVYPDLMDDGLNCSLIVCNDGFYGDPTLAPSDVCQRPTPIGEGTCPIGGDPSQPPFSPTCNENECKSPFTADNEACTNYCSLLGNSDCTVPENKKMPLQLCDGNPVMISNGTKTQTETPDIKGAGAFPLHFTRNYNSQRSLEAQELRQRAIQVLSPEDKSQWIRHVQPEGYKGVETPLFVPLEPVHINNTRVAGYKNWAHNYFAVLEELTDSVRLNSSQFADRRFTQQADGTYKSTNLTSDTLTRSEDGEGNLLDWIYRSADNRLEYYNAQGLLTQRVNRAGLSHYLEYGANNQLSVVRDGADNQLSFTYDDKGKLVKLTSSKGELITYGYDQYANLISVTKKLASGKETLRSYHYEDTRHPYALTGITDETGSRYATWEYNTLGRAVVSKHAGDADKTRFEFTENQTTVTNPLGKQTIYHYNTIAGAKRLETVEGIATASCQAANQNYEYYPDGQLKSKTDWKGIKTEFLYNERNLEKQRTEALGTAEQRVITTTWHSQFNLPLTVTLGNQVTTYSYDSNGQLLAKKRSKI